MKAVITITESQLRLPKSELTNVVLEEVARLSIAARNSSTYLYITIQLTNGYSINELQNKCIALSHFIQLSPNTDKD